MLTASNDGPKSEKSPSGAASAPTPTNWKGVRHGLSHAKECLKAQKLQQAETLIREVLEFAPREPRAWDMLSLLHQMQGRHDEAAKCRDKAAKLLTWETDSYKQPAASMQLAKLLWKQGDRETARAMLAVLLMRRPGDTRLQALRDSWGDED